jgi:Domain of unknown function (DUF4288)
MSTWYAATLLFWSEVGDVPSLRPLCEERVVLLRAATKAMAEANALRHGAAEAHSYKNARGENVNWSFAGIEKLEELSGPPSAGVWEVSSRYVRRARGRLPKGAKASTPRTRARRGGDGRNAR